MNRSSAAGGLLLLLVLATVASGNELEATTLVGEDEEVVLITSVEAGLPAVGPGKSGRVGAWAHGSSFEDDMAFFSAEDQKFRAYFMSQQEKLKDQKHAERKKNYDAKKMKARKDGVDDDVNTAEDTTFMTVSSINTRTANRRKILDGKDIALKTKLKTLTIDVRAFMRRFRKSQVLNASSATDKDYARIVSRYYSHAAAVNATPRSGLFAPLLAAWPYYDPLPVVLLDETVLKTLQHELDHLSVDAKVLDGELHRAELGLHENEKKLRETTIKKGSTELAADEKTPAAAETKGVAAIDPLKKKAQDRLLSYAETRATVMQDDVFIPLRQVRQVINNNLEHHHSIMKANLQLLSAQIPTLKASKALLDREMASNDESTVAKRREMKELTKRVHHVSKSIKDMEGLVKYFSPRVRRHSTSSVDNLLLALERNAQLRQQLSAMDSSEATVLDWLSSRTSLTGAEISRYILLPIAVSACVCVAWMYCYAFGVQMMLVYLARYVERNYSSHQGRLLAAARDRRPDEPQRFDLKGHLLTLASFGVRLLNALLSVATLMSPLVFPLVGMWLSDLFVSPVRLPLIMDSSAPEKRDTTLPTGRAYRPLLYIATVLATDEQCRNVALLVTCVVLVGVALCRAAGPSPRKVTDRVRPEKGRRLGTK